MNANEIMNLGAAEALRTMRAGIGGPFGAVITKGDEVIAIASNTVLQDNDPTAHAEVNAIRRACKKLGTHDLSGYTLYATGSPCPMCMSATIWANIKEVYISGLPEDADAIGFRDEFIYQFIENYCHDTDVVKIHHTDRSIAQKLYKEYQDTQKEMY